MWTKAGKFFRSDGNFQGGDTVRFWLNFLLALCVIAVVFCAVWEFNLSMGEYIRRPVLGLLYSVAVVGFLWSAIYTYLRSHGALQWDWRYLLMARFVISSVFYAMWNFFIYPIGDSLMSVIGMEIVFTVALLLPAPRKREKLLPGSQSHHDS